VTLRASVDGSVEQHRLLLDSASSTVSFDGRLDWVVANDGGWGFYRVRYSQNLIERLATSGTVSELTALDRLGLVSDTWAGVVAGTAGVEQWHAVAGAVQAGEDPDVWGAIATALSALDAVAGDEDRPRLARLVHGLADQCWRSLGWDTVGADPRRATARARVLGVLGRIARDPEILAEAARRFSAHLDGSNELAPDLVRVVAGIVVTAGSEPEWAAVLERYRSSTSPQDKVRYLDALGETRHPDLLGRTLDLCLSPEVRSQDAPFVLRDILARPWASGMTWAWIEDHWDQMTARFPSSLLGRTVEGAGAVCDRQIAERIQRFCTTREMPMAGPRLDQVLERMWITVGLAERLRGHLPEPDQAPTS
jgi:aminopeptidase N